MRNKNAKFFLYAAKKSGCWKDKRLLGVNHSYEGEVTLQDLVDFLAAKNIDPNTVILPRVFSVYAKV
jgi:hypothetical protein